MFFRACFSCPCGQREVFYLLGMADMMVGLGWLFTVGAMFFGIAYGVLNWNREEDDAS